MASLIRLLSACMLPLCRRLLVRASDDDVSGAALPRFKWGQTRERLFVTVVVKGLDRGSVEMSFDEDRLKFQALDSTGKTFDLDLELVQDIDPNASRWEHLQRPDRWGDAVLASLPKKYPGRWDTLVEDAGRYRKVMDRDWNREDQQLEPPEEDTYFREHRQYAPLLTEKQLKKAREGVEALVINVRHKECDQCRVVDETFAKVAKNMSTAKKSSPWYSRVRFGIVDPRSERRLARTLGGFCSTGPQLCRYFVLGHGGGDEAIRIRGRHEEAPLMADLQRLAREQFRPVETSFMSTRNTSRAFIALSADSPSEIRSVAHRLRVQADVGLVADSERAAFGLTAGSVAIWSPHEAEPDVWSSSSGSLEAWLRARVVPPLANTSEYEEDEPYEDMGLPVARLFLKGDHADGGARETVHALAREFVGRVVFLARNATSKDHEWRQHGLPPGRFPAFAAADSMVHNATKYAFLDVPRGNRSSVTSDLAFWSGPAKNALRDFLDDMLARRLPPSFPSDSPPEEEAAWGTVRTLVGRECRQVVETSEHETLIEAYDEWRRDHKNRTKYLDNLAPILARWNITTYRLDLGYNECPPDVLPVISAGYSGYFFVPRMAQERKLRQERLKKLDPSFAVLLKFIAKHSATNFSKSVQLVQQELVASVGRIDTQDYALELWERWTVGSYRKYFIAIVLGLVGILAFFRLRRTQAASPAPEVASKAASAASSPAVS